MGGYGSGKRWSSHLTTDDYRQIDIRWLSRQRGFASGRSGSVTWSRRGEQVASIGYEYATDSLTLVYRSCGQGESEWKNQRYVVPLERQECPFGGSRLWFRCPVVSCRRRCAVLYGGTIFACRVCHQLRYESQRQSASDRATNRAWALLKRLNADVYMCLFDSAPERPKGMHRRTFERLAREYERTRLIALIDAPAGVSGDWL